MNSLMNSSLERYITFGLFFFAADILPDRLHQMRLAEPDAAINKKRIVSARR